MAGNYSPNYYSTLLIKTALDSGVSSPKELANIMGNAHVETWGFSTMHESMRYRTADNLLDAVSSASDRFTRKQIEAAVASHDPVQIATMMYENRKDLSNTERGDGWRFHGRGFFQYTGRYNYVKYGKLLGVDLVDHPELAAEPEMAAKLAIAYWNLKVPVDKRQDVGAAAIAINGGGNGMQERKFAAREWERALTPQLIADIKTGRISPEQFSQAKAKQPTELRNTSTDMSLHQGDAGSPVHELQQVLFHLNYRTPTGQALKVDGHFGPDTRHAVETFQREHALPVDGVVGKDTQAVLAATQANPFTNQYHSHHALYEQALNQVHAEESRRHIHPGQHSERLAGALMVEAARQGMVRIDRVELNDKGNLVRAVQVSAIRDEPGLNRMTEAISTGQATQQSIRHSSEQMQQVSTLQHQHPMQQTVSHPDPSLGHARAM